MAEITKGEAVEFAATIKKLVDALVLEGFDEFWARDFVFNMYRSCIGKYIK